MFPRHRPILFKASLPDPPQGIPLWKASYGCRAVEEVGGGSGHSLSNFGDEPEVEFVGADGNEKNRLYGAIEDREGCVPQGSVQREEQALRRN